MNKKRKLAHRVVSEVLNELAGRKGFDEWWDDIPKHVQRELVSTLRSTVYDELTRKVDPKSEMDRKLRTLWGSG